MNCFYCHDEIDTTENDHTEFMGHTFCNGECEAEYIASLPAEDFEVAMAIIDAPTCTCEDYPCCGH